MRPAVQSPGLSKFIQKRGDQEIVITSEARPPGERLICARWGGGARDLLFAEP